MNPLYAPRPDLAGAPTTLDLPFHPDLGRLANAVESFFSKMTRQHIRRAVFRSIADLQATINACLAEHNASPKPFVWTKSAAAFWLNSIATRYPMFDSVH